MDPRGLWHRRCQSLERGRSVCPNMCVRQGKGKGWGGRGQIVHGAHPSWMKLLPGPCPSVTVAAAVTKVLPWRGGHKKAWRGNGSRGQEWGSGGQGSQPAGQHTRGGQGEKRRREGLVFFLLFLPFLPCDSAGRETSDDWTSLDINIELGLWDESGWWGVLGVQRRGGVHRIGPPQRPGLGGLH